MQGGAASTSTSTALTYTSLEGNSWTVAFARSGVRVLIDPWLVEKLSFGGLEFIYAGSKRTQMPDIDDLAAQTDLLVLTMVCGRAMWNAPTQVLSQL